MSITCQRLCFYSPILRVETKQGIRDETGLRYHLPSDLQKQVSFLNQFWSSDEKEEREKEQEDEVEEKEEKEEEKEAEEEEKEAEEEEEKEEDDGGEQTF